jgi:small conductance mechanosensitive channel
MPQNAANTPDSLPSLEGALKFIELTLWRWFGSFMESVPNLIVAALVLLIFYFIGRQTRMITSKLGLRFTHNKSAIAIVSAVAFLLVFLIGVSFALGILQLDKMVTSILAGAGVLGLVLGFAFQEIAANFISGIFLAFQQPYRLGDIVEIGAYMGTVEEIGLRVTRIKTFQGLDVLVPNKQMFTEPLINYTLTDERRIDFEVGISYGEDLRRVAEIAREALEKVSPRLKNREIGIFFTDFADSSINFIVQLWVPYPGNNAFRIAKHEAIIHLKEAFDKNGITIPFPIRTLDFKIKDGEKNPS